MSTQQAKPAAPKPAAPANKKSGGIPAGVIILILFAVALSLYKFVMGDPSHFENNNPDGHPIPGDYFGIVYKGGWVVPILLTLNLLVFIFAIERSLTISKAKGTKNVAGFVRTISAKLNQRDINGAIAACDAQKGSVGNVVKAGLLKYKDVTAIKNALILP